MPKLPVFDYHEDDNDVQPENDYSYARANSYNTHTSTSRTCLFWTKTSTTRTVDPVRMKLIDQMEKDEKEVRETDLSNKQKRKEKALEVLNLNYFKF